MGGRVLIQRATHNAQNLYFSLRRATAQDSRLSFEARGMLIYLLSKPDDWHLQIADLMREGELGRNRVYRLIKELIGARYIARTFVRDDKKHIQGVTYLVYEEPYPENQKTADLFTGNQEIGKLKTGNQDTGFGDSIQNRESDKEETLLENIEGEEDARAENAVEADFASTEPIEEETERGPDSSTQEDSTPPTLTPSSAIPPNPPPIVLEGLGMSSMAALSRQDAELKAFRAVKADPFYAAFIDAWRATLPADKHDTLVPEVMPSDALKHQEVIDRLKLMQATPEHVRKVVASKRAAGKHQYPFPWLPKDVQALQVKEADVANGKQPPASKPAPSRPTQPTRKPVDLIKVVDGKMVRIKGEDRTA